MVLRKYHGLWYLYPILYEPTILHPSLLSSWVDIHARDHQCIFSISRMPLGITYQLEIKLDNQDHEAFQMLE